MIGVIAGSGEQGVVREFFELFKTPWEFCRNDRQYDVLISAGEGQIERTARLVLVYAGSRTHFDEQRQIQTGRASKQPCILSYHGHRIPIYGDSITFWENRQSLLTEEGSQACAAFVDGPSEGVWARIGYDLFSEIRTLLTVGQPAANASMPALELHIEFLRDLITGCGVPLVEIPAVPDGYQFLACLTHDVDHPSIRAHKWDHTAFGFIYRALVGSFFKLIRGRLPIEDLLANWAAALKLPLVYLGLAKDFWGEFDDRYLELEGDLPSTFFAIPWKDYPGRRADGPAPAFRASRRAARDIVDTLQKLIGRGREVGLHGVDAWLDSSKGAAELEEIRRLTGASEIGVRMHWLYFDPQSPAVLEKAGAAYDSTIGYNETVGYRAGTTQAYQPLEASQLLELPLHVMDTALFYPSYLDLDTGQAKVLLGRMMDNVVRFGGVLTINWHDRSVTPERLWGACYRDLLADAKSRGAWFSTAGEAVSWFRKRRSATFETDSTASEAAGVRVAVHHRDHLPNLRLRIYGRRNPTESESDHSKDYSDLVVEEMRRTGVTSEVQR